MLIPNANEANQYFIDSYKYALKSNDLRQQSLALTNQAEVVRYNGSPAEALLINDEALALIEDIKDENSGRHYSQYGNGLHGFGRVSFGCQSIQPIISFFRKKY